MLQNRVDPFGNIIATPARGNLMGNRGVIHDIHQKIVRPFKHKAWITCALQFKERHRQVMSPNRWTELFFLDEATAFAAGHRPCAECRRESFNQFKHSWLKGNPQYNFDPKVSINDIDDIIHKERIAPDGNKITYEHSINNLPSGTFIVLNDVPFLVENNMMNRWSVFGYDKRVEVPNREIVTVLTPKSIVNAFVAGYQPIFSPYRNQTNRDVNS